MKSTHLPWKIGLAVTAALLLFAGCGPKGPGSAAIPPDSSTKVLRLLSWSDYFDPEVLAGFEERTGIRIEYVTFSGLDDAYAKLRSQPGYYDVVVTDNSALSEFWEVSLIDRLDLSKIPHIANIDPKFVGLPFDPQNEFSIPYLWGTTLVAYRADKIEEPVGDWSILWDESLKGKVMVMVDRVETLSVALMMLGYSLNSAEPNELGRARDKLIDQIYNVDVRYGDDADVRAGLDDGSIWAAMCYSGDAAMVAAENENVAFFIPRDGAPLWIDNFAIVRDSNFPDQAHRFIDYMIEAETAAANANYTFYASPNKGAVPFIDPDLLTDETVNPPQEVLDRCEFFIKSTAEREDITNHHWLEVQRIVNIRERERAAAAEASAAASPSFAR